MKEVAFNIANNRQAGVTDQVLIPCKILFALLLIVATVVQITLIRNLMQRYCNSWKMRIKSTYCLMIEINDHKADVWI